MNKLHDVVRRARDQPVDDPAKKLRERLEGASAETVMILDVSGSMMDTLSGKRKFDYVEIAAKDVWKYFPAIRTVVFDSISRVHRNGAPSPSPREGRRCTWRSGTPPNSSPHAPWRHRRTPRQRRAGAPGRRKDDQKDRLHLLRPGGG